MEKLIKIFKALSNKIRLQIFLILCRENSSVCELQEILNIKQSRLSHQLRLLRYAGLVETSPEGKRIIYSTPKKIKKDRFIRTFQDSIKLNSLLKKRLSTVKTSRTWNKR